jgi:hypothetical protein
VPLASAGIIDLAVIGEIRNLDAPAGDSSSKKSEQAVVGDIGCGVVGLVLFAISMIVLVYVGYSGALHLVVVVLPTMAILPFAAIYMTIVSLSRWKKLTVGVRAVRTILLATILAAAGCLFLIPRRPLFDMGVKLRVARAGGIDNVQDWAVELLKKESISADESGLLDVEALPEHIRQLKPTGVAIFDGPPEYRHVRIGWGGGFFHWGLMVGPPTYTRAEGGNPMMVTRWRKGVYIYTE